MSAENSLYFMRVRLRCSQTILKALLLEKWGRVRIHSKHLLLPVPIGEICLLPGVIGKGWEGKSSNRDTGSRKIKAKHNFTDSILNKNGFPNLLNPTRD